MKTRVRPQKLTRIDLVSLALEPLHRRKSSKNRPVLFSVYKLDYKITSGSFRASNGEPFSYLFWYHEELDILVSLDFSFNTHSSNVPSYSSYHGRYPVDAILEVLKYLRGHAIAKVRARTFATLKINNPWGNEKLTAAVLQAYTLDNAMLLAMVYGTRIVCMGKINPQVSSTSWRHSRVTGHIDANISKTPIFSVEQGLAHTVEFGSVSTFESDIIARMQTDGGVY
jgi:hypothetical protein